MPNEPAGNRLEQPDASPHLGWAAAVLFGAALVFYADLDGGARLSQIDCWVAQTAREMRETGDWLVPHFAGEIRLHKTPGPYWLAAGLAALRGTDVDATTIRAINATFAVALVAAMLWWAWVNLGPRTGVYVGATLAGSLFAIYWSHQGSSDLGVAFFCTAAAALLFQADNAEKGTRRRFWLWMAFYAACGLGMLHKGPIPVPVLGFVFVGYLLVFRRWRLPLEMHLPAGSLAFLIWFAPWVGFVLATRGQDALNRWYVEFLGRAVGDMPNYQSRPSSVGYHLSIYIAVIAVFLVPWTLSLPAALALPFRKAWSSKRRPLLFLFVWACAVWLFFTLSVGKENRYILPAIPPLAALLGAYFSEFFRTGRPRNDRLVRLGVLVITVLLPLGLIGGGIGAYVWASQTDPGAWPALGWRYAVLAVVLLVGFGAAAWLYWRRRESASFAAMVATMLGSWLWTWPMLMSVFVSQQTHYEFAVKLKELLRPQDVADTYYLGPQDARVIYYSNFRIPRVIEPIELLRLQEGREYADVRELMLHRMRLVGERCYRLLIDSDNPVWIVSSVPDYKRLTGGLREHEAELDRGMPAIHEWYRSTYGKEKYQAILFSNVPAPPPRPAPSDRANPGAMPPTPGIDGGRGGDANRPAAGADGATR